MNKFKIVKKSWIKEIEDTLEELVQNYYGGIFSGGTGTKQEVKSHSFEINKMRERLSVLEEIVRESGLITDFDKDEVKIREDRKFSIFGGIEAVNIPYQINKVKVK